MEQPVRFELLQSITGGNSELERELFAVFLESAQECLDGLASTMQPDQSTLWKNHAHALKGICLNLGAEHMGNLCRLAQEDFRALPEDKAVVLRNIKAEMGLVSAALQQKLKQSA